MTTKLPPRPLRSAKRRACRTKKLAFGLKVVISIIAIANLGLSLVTRAESADSPQSGTLYITNDNGEKFTALSLTTDVKMNITGLTARIKVKQSFKNNRDQWMEGTYQFPLPDKAAVDHLSMQIGERIVLGEIKEKQEAKKIIDSLPEDTSYDEILKELVFDRMIQRGLKDSAEKKTISNQKMKNRIKQW